MTSSTSPQSDPSQEEKEVKEIEEEIILANEIGRPKITWSVTEEVTYIGPDGVRRILKLADMESVLKGEKP